MRFAVRAGLAPRSAFFHAVANRSVARDLKRLGLAAQFVELPASAPDASEWRGVRRRYWGWQQSYQLPVVYWADRDDDEGGGSATDTVAQV